MKRQELLYQLTALNEDLNKQIAVIDSDDQPVDPYLLKDATGRYIFADVLVAKANVLTALLQLELTE